MRALITIAIASMLTFGGAVAQTPIPAPTPVPSAPLTPTEASLHGYGDNDRTCEEWTDSCRNCRRSDPGGPTCSNIGPTCQPKAITCSKRAEVKPEETKTEEKK